MHAKLRERDLGRHRCRWDVNSETGLIKYCQFTGWNIFVKNSVYWLFLVHTVKQIWGPQKAGDLRTIHGTTGMSKTTLICEISQTAAHHTL
jgi:hypothetical protein